MEFIKWNNIEGETNQRMIKITKSILFIINKKGDWEKNDNKTYQKVMNHICIIELQYFPGLAFSSKKTDDRKLQK